ncbi:hypothetical protein C8J56DRAFT_892001 [Mycena floridula]|nr:hypothetical protein C8J56DRAFT_892001 [Mycena floridula]
MDYVHQKYLKPPPFATQPAEIFSLAVQQLEFVQRLQVAPLQLEDQHCESSRALGSLYSDELPKPDLCQQNGQNESDRTMPELYPAQCPRIRTTIYASPPPLLHLDSISITSPYPLLDARLPFGLTAWPARR